MATRKRRESSKALAKKAELAPVMEAIERSAEETQAKSIVLPTWVWDALQKEADAEDRSLNRQVGRILREHVESKIGR
jgi:hypothetical protein